MANNISFMKVVDFIPASLHENKSWEVVFYAKDPQSGELKRKRIRVNYGKDLKERRYLAKQMIFRINEKLNNGWNPFIEEESPRSFHKILDVFDSFMRDKRDLRPDSLRTYKSEIKFLKEFVLKFHQADMYAVAFNKDVAIRYMESAWESRNIGARRYNNIIVTSRIIFNWMVEKGYTKQSPFDVKYIKKKKQPPKQRIMEIEPEDRKKIREYLRKTNRPFYAMMLFAFHSLLRPKEISYIRIGDIDLKKQVVTVKGSVAKNGKTRYATIPDVMKDLIKELIEEIPVKNKNWYLFSKNNFRPGTKRRDSREIARYWADLRTTLKLKKENQFYSLRDSGIIQMLKDGRNPKEVMEAADHSIIEMTNNYVKMARKETSYNIRKKSTAF